MLTVEHKEYGRGVAICFHESDGVTYLVVDFGGRKESFRYPQAFAEEISACDPAVAKAIAEELAALESGEGAQ